MPSTTELATVPTLNVDTVDSKYTSFKSMTDSTSSTDDVKCLEKEIDMNHVHDKNDTIAMTTDQSLKNTIVTVNNGEELDVLIKMERANK